MGSSKINSVLFVVFPLLKKEANLIDSFPNLGIKIDSSIDKILSQINLLRLKNNPINVSKDDIIKILND